MVGLVGALLPLSIFGLIFTVPLNILEFGLMIATVIVNVMAVVKTGALVKELANAPESAEKAEAEGYVKVAKILAIVGFIATAVSVTLLTFLNFAEILLSFI